MNEKVRNKRVKSFDPAKFARLCPIVREVVVMGGGMKMIRDGIIAAVIAAEAVFVPIWEWESGIEMVMGAFCVWFITMLLLYGSNKEEGRK